MFEKCRINLTRTGWRLLNKIMENKTRYWFVVFNYSTATGFGNGNLGVGAIGFDLKGIHELAYKQSPDALYNSIVITNFIEMTEEDYMAFWKK
jgi:hypothetical protein